MQNKILLLLCCLSVSSIVIAQTNIWKNIQREEIPDLEEARELFPEKAAYFDLKISDLQQALRNAPGEEEVQINNSTTVIPVPFPDGEVIQFKIISYEMLEPELAAQYPNFKNFRGVGVDHPNATLRFDWTTRGFRAVLRKDGQQIFIDPYARGNQRYYMSYFKKDYPNTKNFECLFQSEDDAGERGNDLEKSAGDCQFREYRLAVATTGEYSNFFGASTAGTPADEALVLAEVNTAINRVNEVYERDLGIRFLLIANTVDVFYYNGNTDPYTNSNGVTMLGQNQTNLNNVIGNANYDVGHVFSTGGGGVASLGVSCNNSFKARGVTGLANPTGDPFYIDYVAHEIGHQFGANHTQNNSCQRNSATSYEPGSASTIMGYAGICSPNVQNNSDDYFHAISIQEIANYITNSTGGICPVTSSGNTPPVVNDPGNFSIPRSTPFVLSATASDANSDPLTYCWEQWDRETGSPMPPQSTSSTGPLFRSLDPTSSPERYFINLPDLAAGVDPTWEELPSVARDMEFRVTVRDNNSNYGCTDEQNIDVTVTSSNPFVVQAPNTNTTLFVGQNYNVQWDEAQTAQSPISCSTVDIFLSTDGGLSFPTLLLANTSNDGSATVIIPSIVTTTARVMVRCSEGVGIFFDISNTNFAIENSNPDYTLSSNPSTNSSCGENSIDYTIEIGSIQGYSDPVTLSTSGLPSGATAAFSPNPVTPGGSSTLTIGNLNAVAEGNYTFNVNGSSTSGNQNIQLSLEVINDCSGPAPCLQFDTGPFNNFEPPVCFPNCQTPTTLGFEVFANESYVIRDLTPGAEYTFEFCNGYDPATWAANITVAVWDDANGTATANVETVSGCSVTFTAPAGGDVVVIIFDTCGNPTLEVDNGTPTFRCTGNGSTLPTACVGAGDCSDPILLTCGDNVSGNTANGQNNFNTQGNFTNYGGPELVYEFQAEPGALDIQLTNLSADVDLFLTAPCNNSDPAQIAASRNAGTTSESITGTLNNGGTFYIIIDGFGGAVSTFDLSVTCTSPPNNCPNNLPVNDNPIATGTYKAANTITSVGRVASGTTVTFEAGQSITLSPGFIAENGSTFTARIQPCTSTRPSDIEDRNEVLEVFTVAAGTAVAENEVKVYPNPFSTQTMVEVQLSVESDLQIELYSLAGKRISVVASNRDVAAGVYQFPVDATRLESGMYLLMIRIDEEIQTQKLSLIK